MKKSKDKPRKVPTKRKDADPKDDYKSLDNWLNTYDGDHTHGQES